MMAHASPAANYGQFRPVADSSQWPILADPLTSPPPVDFKD